MKNGFTLVELLAVIVLVAIISLTMGISANKILKNTEIKQNQSTYEDIFSAASVYSSLPSKLSICSNECSITIKTMIESGLLDKNKYAGLNPLFENKNFNLLDYVYVTYSNGEKILEYHSYDNSSCYLSEKNLDSYDKWGKCK